MKRVSILGLVLVIVMLVPGMISCSGETSGSSATTYTTQASPTVLVKTVPVPVTHTVVVPAHNPSNPAWWHNWHWPWYPAHP